MAGNTPKNIDTSPKPSDLELQILALLWRHGPMTVRQVLESLPDQRKRAYTSVLSIIQIMEKKGFLTHTQSGNTHIYSPTLTRAKVLGQHMRRLVTQIFNKSAPQAIQQLLDDTPVTRGELEEIRKILDNCEAQLNQKPSQTAKPSKSPRKRQA
jgi:BlaI family transcriptional regulator, penicillinase repressor